MLAVNWSKRRAFKLAF